MMVVIFASAWRERQQRVPIRYAPFVAIEIRSCDTHSGTPPRDESAEIDSKNA